MNKPSIFNNNILQISAGAQVYASADGNVVRVSIFQNGDRDGEHIQFYKDQAKQLHTALTRELEFINERDKKASMT